MSGTTREQFIRRVSEALGRPGPRADAPPPPVVRDEVVCRPGPGDDAVGAFCERAEAVGLRVHRCTRAGARAVVADLLKELGIRSIVSSVADCPAFEAALDEAGVQRLAWRDDTAMARHYDADAGATDAEAAFADSGTIVVRGDGASGRGLYLVPPIHLAVLRAAAVLADQLDFMRRLRDVRPGDLPAGRTFITGPSKTADIEGVLVTGVHGPAAVHVILIED